MDLNTHEVESTFLVPLEYLMENPPEMHYMDMMPKVDDGFPYEKIDFKKDIDSDRERRISPSINLRTR